MTYICKTFVIVHIDGKRKEIPPGSPLPAGVDDDALDDLLRLEAVELDAALPPETRDEVAPANQGEVPPESAVAESAVAESDTQPGRKKAK